MVQDAPESHTSDWYGVVVEAGDKRDVRFPALRCEGHTALQQVSGECMASKRSNLPSCSPLPYTTYPVVVVFVPANVAKSRVNNLRSCVT